MLINLNNRVSYKLALLSVSSAIIRGHRVPWRWACSPACCQRSPFPQAHRSHECSTFPTGTLCQQGAWRPSLPPPFVCVCAHLLPTCSCTEVHQEPSVLGTCRNGSCQASLQPWPSLGPLHFPKDGSFPPGGSQWPLSAQAMLCISCPNGG